jgi:hypothetical protein
MSNDDFKFTEVTAQSNGLKFGYGPKPPAKSINQPMIATANGASLSNEQIATIRSHFGNDIVVSDDRSVVKLPTESAWKPEAELKFSNVAAEIANAGRPLQGSIQLSNGVQSMDIDLRPSIRGLMHTRTGSDMLASFDFDKDPVMDKYKGKPLKEIARNGVLPDDLAAKVDEMGKQFLKLTERDGKSIADTKEFGGMDIKGVDGKPDARKVGAILFAAASYQSDFNKTDGPMVFDNKLTFTDMDRLNDPSTRQFIQAQASNLGFSKNRGMENLKDLLKQQGIGGRGVNLTSADNIPAGTEVQPTQVAAVSDNGRDQGIGRST